MKSLVKFSAVAAALFLSMGAVSTSNAAVVDIPEFIDGVGGYGEKAVSDGTQVTIDGLTFAVSASNSDGSTPADSSSLTVAPFAYFDSNSGGPGGLGVCQKTDGAGTDPQCDPSNDDNVTGTDDSSGFDEVLSLDFDPDDQGTNYDVSDLQFRNANHGVTYDAGSKISISVNGGAFQEYTLGTTAATAGDVGQRLTDLTELTTVQTISFRYYNAQFYLSGFTTSEENVPVPLPAGLLLMLSGLFGLGFLGRYKAKYS